MTAKLCPLMMKPCVADECAWYIHVRGQHPQTKADVDHGDCAMRWLPTLQIETSKEVRQGAAATESFRNEMVGASERLRQTVVDAATTPILGAPTQARLINGESRREG